jgi:hypothetical protein
MNDHELKILLSGLADGSLTVDNIPRAYRGRMAVNKLKGAQTAADSPESRMWFKVLEQAVSEAAGNRDDRQRKAINYLRSDYIKSAELVGINTQYVREVVASLKLSA